MDKKTSSTKAYNDKIKTPMYRMVTKKTYGAKKYYYSVLPASKKGDEVEITMKTGSKYIGQVNEKNERNGFGIYYVIHGGTYEGYWLNGFKNGQGKFFNKEGRLVYDGLWECGEPHGQGILYDKNNKVVYNGFMNKGKTSNGKLWTIYK
jgi:hypothetical protein